ncbi:MAG TPA: Na/Pi cotransporter family protein [Acetobacteraceae bacterium]|jgi:phosphate:Na+ symporter|nr:Na/Pi cotransporter family protein [Acetobacteraceae bacterium]
MWDLLNLAGSVALLLWGLHMVQTGIQRGFGPDLRRVLGTALGNRLAAFAAGLGVTAILQSSTATGLMVAGFATGGAVALVPALAVMLGANVGTTLIVQLLSFNVAEVAPALILLGVVLFRRGTAARTRDLGRVAIGLGLMLMALHQLVVLVTPYEDVPSLRLVLGAITTEPVLDVLVAAGLTWAAHSSVAVVLLVMSFAAKGAVPPEAAFALVLGANLGTAINPILEGVSGDDPVARRLPLGNLLNRALGCVVALALLHRIGPWMVQFEGDPARAVADFHTLFNLVLAALFLPALGPYAWVLRKLLPARVAADDPSRPRYLDQTALESPPIALAAAAREALRMADALEAMLAQAADALASTDRRRIGEVRRLDDVLDRLNTAIRAYLTQLDPEDLSEGDHRRLSQVLVFATNFEAAGDVVDRDVMGHAAKRLKRGRPLAEGERAAARRLLDRLAVTVRAAAAVFMTEDARAARQLAAEKEAFRDLETVATQAHFAARRGAAGDQATLDLDLVRELKRVNGHLVAAAAYPVLEGQGELLSSRLRLDS